MSSFTFTIQRRKIGKDLFLIFVFIVDLFRQGDDIGTQYRSVIFYHDSVQQKEAEMLKAHLVDENVFKGPIVTQIVSIEEHPFYSAEEYHQNYFNRNPSQGYCSAVVKGKVDKFVAKFSDLLKNQI